MAETAPVSTEVVRFEFTPKSIMVGLGVLMFFLGGVYLMDFNKTATKGYLLKNLEISQQELQDQNDLKTLALAKAKAMNQMISSGEMEGMRKAGDVQYIYGDSSVIAKVN